MAFARSYYYVFFSKSWVNELSQIEINYAEQLQNDLENFFTDDFAIYSTDDLDLQIKSIQVECDHLDLLLSEFVGDKIKTPTKRNIKSQKDALWKLITDLEKAFEHSNKSILTPEVPELFKGAIECSNQGFQKLYNSYDIGINRSNDIFKQDIERSVVRDTT
ncbi:13213_t:CDS:2, partial [Entrophospora sp. SA101]